MPQIGRRRFITAVPAAVAATVAVPSLASAQRGGGAPPKFGKDVLKCAEQIDGLHFTDSEEELAAAGASRNLDRKAWQTGSGQTVMRSTGRYWVIRR